ncbi:LysE family translocator [Burkholderia humptydooensis]|uniref:LysE family translocator n=2 Tax=Burkholderia humptydooensis TaxID=430531 RepID=A0A7U4P784_9BURK|nr:MULTISPECIES: LysE family translocator [Burkholderia]AJY42395.1 lysE type translocator family protein [Burkholderia sp. 2002721687]ALX44172.1 lysine transporter LysE [Burkholderia humptydooensis]QPS45664.1 LysE family translocator [Burkholderia humptydooensis]
MIQTSTLSLFAAAVLVLLMSPGPNMAFVIAHGAAHGLRGGVAAALGIGAADLVLTALTAAGVATAVAAWPPSFDLIRYAGAAYLLWMAYRAVCRPGSLGKVASTERSLWSVGVRAMLNSLSNPKALLFFIVFLPQFVDRHGASVAGQLAALGCALAAISVAFHALLGAAGHMVRGFIGHRAASAGLAALFVLLAVRLATMSRLS